LKILSVPLGISGIPY